MGSTTDEPGRTKRVAKWYHGGLASASAAMCTHPLDLLKVHLQTQQKVQLGLVGKYRTAIHAYSLVTSQGCCNPFYYYSHITTSGYWCVIKFLVVVVQQLHKIYNGKAALPLYILCNGWIQQGVKLLCFN